MNGEQYFAPKHIFGHPSQEMTHSAVTAEAAREDAADPTGKWGGLMHHSNTTLLGVLRTFAAPSQVSLPKDFFKQEFTY